MTMTSAERAKLWRARNPERAKATNRRWNEANKIRWHAALAQNSKRLRRATPPWADRIAMIDIYEQAKRLSAKSGRRMEVDHVVPIRGRNVCGLHVPGNLQIIERIENKQKGNRLLTA